MVARPADVDAVAGPQRVVDVRRAAAAGLLAQHAEPVAATGRGVAGQRVLPREPAGQLQVEVRARLPGRAARGRPGRPARPRARRRTRGSSSGPGAACARWWRAGGPGAERLSRGTGRGVPVTERNGRSLCGNAAGLRLAAMPVRRAPWSSTSAAWCCATPASWSDLRPGRRQRRLAGPDDERWQAMLRHEITEREYWAHRARRDRRGARPRRLVDPRPDHLALPRARTSEFVDDEMVELMVDARAAGLPRGRADQRHDRLPRPGVGRRPGLAQALRHRRRRVDHRRPQARPRRPTSTASPRPACRPRRSSTSTTCR